MTTQAILAIDGGGTHCQAVLCDMNGTELGRADGAFANLVTDFEQSRQNLSDLINAVYEAVGRARVDRSRDLAVLGIAGAEIGGAGKQLEEAVTNAFGFAAAKVLSDRDIAVEGILGDGDGTLAQIGTGSFFAQKQGGTIRHIGGWGLTLGDEASGAWLGRELLRSVLLTHDGLMASTDITRAIMEMYGNSPDEIVLFAGTALPGDYASLVPMLFDAFANDDQVARHVVGLGLVSLETVLMAVAGDNQTRLFVTGGVGERYRPLLSDHFRARLAMPTGDPLSGAIRVGRAMLGH